MNGIYTPEGTVNKDALWAKYQYLIRYEALKLQAKLPGSIELDDLIQAASIAFMHALDQYDKNKGIALSTYLANRIRWALIDELRENDWVPRRVRANSREISSVISRLEQKQGRIVTESEIAEEMGISLDEYHQMLIDSNTSQIFSLDELQEEYPDSIDEISSQQEFTDPAQSLMAQSLTAQISDSIKNLPERDQLLLSLYYQQELNMKEIALILGISEVRVSQLHSQAIKRLRAYLSPDA
ncbi:TPA: RNA polymerase sigma factor FliA [Morganella morganii]|uniref:RNA polymerase sigma factor FliA n=1 Tax=Morganella morganii TaxID=582 RepID=UPI001A23EAA4|nr:RNA polymerase sigma factor FliA [Morganella morganii]HDF2365558.1 RNA polymerase sigma factor FliA [Morganella morganii]HDF2424120.1 RNA polymerase sigma factor FliA [Morganella morganii]